MSYRRPENIYEVLDSLTKLMVYAERKEQTSKQYEIKLQARGRRKAYHHAIRILKQLKDEYYAAAVKNCGKAVEQH